MISVIVQSVVSVSIACPAIISAKENSIYLGWCMYMMSSVVISIVSDTHRMRGLFNFAVY